MAPVPTGGCGGTDLTGARFVEADVSVGGEWSFAQTLRHLVMATDLWLGRVILAEEWEHLRYAVRDLDALEAEPAG